MRVLASGAGVKAHASHRERSSRPIRYQPPLADDDVPLAVVDVTVLEEAPELEADELLSELAEEVELDEVVDVAEVIGDVQSPPNCTSQPHHPFMQLGFTNA